MVHRVATSETYRLNPTAVRTAMSFRDFLHANVVLDFHEAKAARDKEAADAKAAADASGGRRHG